MQAKETRIQDILEGTKQYVVPLFQRTYSWTDKEWGILWEDIVELCESEKPRLHFIGSIVSMPAISVPEGVAKFLLIDGQQRLTTIFILLTLLRNKAKESQDVEFAEEINNTLLVNPYKKDCDFFKLMPTQVDRDAYKNLINGQACNSESPITKAYTFFERKLKRASFDLKKIKKIITNYFSVVSIVLDAGDNPYLVFESLNAKGKPLEQADLIRNYFFMCMRIDEQDKNHESYWMPMQNGLGEYLTEYIRHFLMKDGNIIRQNDVYYVLKDQVSPSNALGYLEKLHKYSTYYQRLVKPEDFEANANLRRYFRRLNTIEVTTAYPLLLNLYGDYEEGTISEEDFVEILKTLENYLVRRFVCNYSTSSLRKNFAPVYSQLTTKHKDNFVEGFKIILQGKGYPKDHEFFTRFKETRLYGAGERQKKTKLILETLEESLSPKEVVSFDNLTIEHIMPQTLTEWWQKHLGDDWKQTHEDSLHTIGNLTLTGYNAELSNADFPTKKRKYKESNLGLNKYFDSISSWRKAEIEKRSEMLAKKALEIWSYFGQEKTAVLNSGDVTGTIPTEITILGEKIEVQTWRDVLEKTLNKVAERETDGFETVAKTFPRFITKERGKLREARQLQNGYFVEVNLGAKQIQRVCLQVLDSIGISSEDWSVTVKC